MADTTSIQLLERLQVSNGTHSWSRFYQIYEPFMRRWLAQAGVQDSDAADVVQNVLCVVINELPRFCHNGNVGAFRCWLRRATANQLRQQRRKNWRTPHCGADLESMADTLVDSGSDCQRSFELEHDRFLFTTLLGSLENDFAPTTIRAFRMTALEARLPAEVAAELGLSRAAVIAGKSRILCRLREEAERLFGKS